MSWSIEEALHFYNIPHWGEGYFSINAQGEVVIQNTQTGAQLSLPYLLDQLKQQGLKLPLLVRLPFILHDRIGRMHQAFAQAKAQLDYSGQYWPLYPIKVNQQRRVIEEIVQAQQRYGQGRVGLEAGSKAELLAIIALANGHQATLVCNGYKDPEFIRIALVAQQLGHRVIIVIEKLSELAWIIEASEQLGCTPELGVRARLASIGRGNWQNTGGDKSKFGLHATELLQLIEQLQQHNALPWLTLLHVHLGSQIANIDDMRTGLCECARIYTELMQLGVGLNAVDVGGGLGVDYEGTGSRSVYSMNYAIEDYALQVMRCFHEAAQQAGYTAPDIFTESGRALSAHHALLLTEVIGVERICEQPIAPATAPVHTQAQRLLESLWQWQQALQRKQGSALEVYHHSMQAIEQAKHSFLCGECTLVERAQIEQASQSLMTSLCAALDPGIRPHRAALDDLNERLADKLFVNFSLFQSLPDIWGIGQIFPILPIAGLDQRPQRRGVIQDITCDSDGRIHQYVDGQGIESTLPLPDYDPQHPLRLAFFMVGAYQEILGDMHNLFGDTDAVDVVFDATGQVQI